MYSINQIKENITTIDRQLLFMIYEEQKETNRLLSILANENNQSDIAPVTHIEGSESDLDTLKRPELMKRFAKLSNKPQGWNKWDTEVIRNHLKGAS